MTRYSDVMGELKQYGSILKECTTFLPVIWVLFVFTEWWMLRKHYRYFRIDHSYRPNYKIAFDPRYLLSLVFTVSAWIGLQLVTENILAIYLSGPIVIFLWGMSENLVNISSRTTKPFFERLRPPVNNEEVKESFFKKILNRYDESVEMLKEAGLGVYVARIYMRRLRVRQRIRALTIRVLLSVIVTAGLFSSAKFFPSGFEEAWRAILFAFLCPVVHSFMFKIYTPNFYDKDFLDFEYIRVVEEESKTYAILAPTTYDSNTIGVAVRAVVCRREDGFIVAYLVHEDYKVYSVPSSGNYVRVNVDLVGRIAPETKETYLLPGYMIKELLQKLGIHEYMNNGGWRSIEKLS